MTEFTVLNSQSDHSEISRSSLRRISLEQAVLHSDWMSQPFELSQTTFSSSLLWVYPIFWNNRQLQHGDVQKTSPQFCQEWMEGYKSKRRVSTNDYMTQPTGKDHCLSHYTDKCAQTKNPKNNEINCQTSTLRNCSITIIGNLHQAPEFGRHLKQFLNTFLNSSMIPWRLGLTTLPLGIVTGTSNPQVNAMGMSRARVWVWVFVSHQKHTCGTGMTGLMGIKTPLETASEHLMAGFPCWQLPPVTSTRFQLANPTNREGWGGQGMPISLGLCHIYIKICQYTD